MQKPLAQSPIQKGLRHLPTEAGWFVALIALTGMLYGLGLGRLDLWAPDEPRYGAIAEELRSFRHGSTGLVLLHLNDAPYTQKPPLYFWLAAAMGAPTNRVDELAARLPSALAGVLAVALTAWIGRRILARRPVAAWLAAGLLATSFRFAHTARRAQLDVLLTALELVAVALFVSLETRGHGVENARRSPLRVAGLHAALGAAALVKGPVGWLPLLVFVVYLAWEGRLGAMRAITPAWGWLLSLGPLALWAGAAVAVAPPEFAREAIGENVFGRFFSGTSHARPFYYYLYQLPIDLLPWSVLLPSSLLFLWHRARPPAAAAGGLVGDRAVARFLLVWQLAPLLFFTLSAGKRGLYLLPIFPAIALGIAFWVNESGARAGRGGAGVRAVAVAVALVAVLELAAFRLVLPLLDDHKSPRPIAEAVARRSAEDEAIGLYGLRPLEGAIRYYGDRDVASLQDLAALQGFLAEGGRFVLLRHRHLEQLGAELDLREVESFRSGRRRLSLASPVFPMGNPITQDVAPPP